ncbi:276_t:CDS:2 [Diversispora eburnea]|uniref:276_t:CDS:1 n=1 Tax=Diversispora eburnea TaxID=1213867 RepID=A0A9N8VP23_9GLOM|nr:276_t:CDS:2 [Diversispora eburnea]
MSLFQRRSSAKSILNESGLDHEKVSLMNNVDSREFSPHRVYDFYWFKWGAVSKSLTCSFTELPHWLQDNYDIFTGFYCHNTLKIFYITLLSLFGVATIFVATDLRFRTPPYRWFRTGLFFALGGSGFIPIFHAIILYGVKLSLDVIALKWMIMTGGFYVLGAVVYGTRIPESLLPGSFDVWGSSHQIFHFFVLAGTLTHYYGVIQAMTFWHEQNHECQFDIEKMKPL